MLTLRKIIGMFMRLDPSYTRGCQRCGWTWKFTKEHWTLYEERGVMALCSWCWKRLYPRERLEFYNKLYRSWPTHDKEEWKAISRAVLSGK